MTSSGEWSPIRRSRPTVIDDLTVNVSEMFRDPAFFRAVRERLVPLLRTYPRLNIWNSGCATGEEAYSTAILLTEAGLYDRCQIYATDVNARVLERAKEGIYPAARRRAIRRQLPACRRHVLLFALLHRGL